MKIKTFWLFLIANLSSQAARNSEEFTVSDSAIVLGLAWIAGVVIVALLLKKRKYKFRRKD